MAITGIMYKNQMFNNSYQSSRTSRGEEGKGFHIGAALHGEDAKQDAGKAADQTQEMDENTEYTYNARIWSMKTARLTSCVLGFGGLEDKSNFTACYAVDSTEENPVVNVRVTDKNGKVTSVNVNINQVDPADATELEIFALLAHQDAQGMTGNTEFMGSYRELLNRAQNGTGGDLSSKNAEDFMSWKRNWRSMTSGAMDTSAEQMLVKQREETNNKAPYSFLAKDGIIEYNGVTFICDDEHRALRLGDTSDPKKCLNIPLSGGGCLIVNRDSLDGLARAIGMFSPEDVKLILWAIAKDAKIQQMQNEIDEETSGIDLAKETGETEETHS